MFDLQADGTGFDFLDQLTGKLEQGAERALDRSAEVLFQSKVREVSKTYERPIPTRQQVASADKQIVAGSRVRIKGGKKSIGLGGVPAWKRSGAWASGQRIVKPARFERRIITEGPAGLYEARLADLPTGALGINRTNKAAENAATKTAPQLAAVLESELLNALG